MIRLHEPDEVYRSANDLRSIVRASLGHWQAVIERQQLVLSLDLNSAMPVLCQAENTLPLVNTLLEMAIRRSPTHGEVSIVGFRGNAAVELEIADSGACLDDMSRTNAFSAMPRNKKSGGELERLDYQARSFGGRLWCLACPQGGIAWTLYLPSRAIAKRAA